MVIFTVQGKKRAITVEEKTLKKLPLSGEKLTGQDVL